MKLTNLNTGKIISENVESCFSFFQRTKGLIGKESYPQNQSLWIKPCNNIHTLFMGFSIDIIFVNKNLVVVSEKKSIHPWVPLLLQWNAYSVFEFIHHETRNNWATKGDQLHVDT